MTNDDHPATAATEPKEEWGDTPLGLIARRLLENELDDDAIWEEVVARFGCKSNRRSRVEWIRQFLRRRYGGALPAPEKKA